ncbi:ETX/MTX2 family pore-forming toxin [Methylocapsa acidiphila]|uniref:ETX/MTX2 family pore-forming toxin n=1 Tax=Methylocapsa acidiphila TaxID=133552 RepID=UPI00041F0E9A|nr:ETX/MTX2 family pore-forming toxin [Methylocapsa acidiphila]
MNIQVTKENLTLGGELDINAALHAKFQTIDQAALVDRITDYLTSIGKIRDAQLIAAVETQSTEFYQRSYGLLISDFAYGNATPTFKDLVAHEETYVNASPDDPLEATFAYEYSRQDGQSFKFTEGLKIGTKVGLKAKLPLIGESNVEINAEVSFSAEQSFTTTETSRWSFSEKVTVKPNTAVKVTGFIQIAKLDAPFTCHVKVLDGDILVEVKLKGDQGYTSWGVPIVAMMSDDERSLTLSGTLTGSEAAKIFIKETPASVPVL